MPNIKQQKKRVRIAARQRVENLRYRSTLRTLTHRLEEAVQEGDAEAAAERRRSLEHWLDLAAARGAIHRNRAARKKSQAATLVSTVAGSAREAPAAVAEPEPEPEAAAAEPEARRKRGLRRRSS